MKAFVWASGAIGLGESLPKGAILIFNSTNDRLVERIIKLARCDHERRVFLVPGIAEAATEDEAVDAIFKFRAQVEADPTHASEVA
ncbi:MAG: host nuclease inhibitor protein [Mariprofundaceae bacterium]